MKKIIFSSLFLCFVFWVSAQNVQHFAQIDNALKNAVNTLPNNAKIRVLIEVKKGAKIVENSDFVINQRLGNLLSADVEIGYLSTLMKNSTILSIEYGTLEEAVMDSVKFHTNAYAVHKAWGGLERAYLGENIIIGIIDSGVDFTHKEFKEIGDATKTRISSIWCQWDSTGTKPDSFSYGSVYYKKQFEDEFNGITKDAVPQTDFDPTMRGALGHGTHVAGIAAGINGIAPKAEIIAVSVLWESASIIDAIRYVINEAIIANKPCVINLSLGSMNDLHDGTGIKAQAYKALANIRSQGTIIVAAAGNSGDDFVHWGNFELDTVYSTYFYGDPIELVMAIPDSLIDDIAFSVTAFQGDFDYAQNYFSNLVEFRKSKWYTVGEALRDSVKEDLYYPGMFEIAGTFYAKTKPLGKQSKFHYFTIKIDDHADIDVRQKPPKAKGIELYRIDVKGKGKFNAWLMSVSSTYTGSFARIVQNPEMIGASLPANYMYPNNDFSILAPAVYHETFCVGAFVNRWSYFDVLGAQQPARWARRANGSLADFSSRGPSVDGRILPEIVAPGQNVLSAIPDYYNGWSPKVIDGKYAASSGTSMASPVVAGAIALFLEKNPNANLEMVRKSFLENTQTDTFTSSHGNLPNNHWGYGKLDIFKVMSGGIFFAQNDLEPLNISIYPNPAQNEIHISNEIVKASIFSIDGKLLKESVSQTIDVTFLQAGTYLIKIESLQGLAFTRFIVL